MKAMILAAGRGERMRPLTDTLPKPLIPVGDECLIERHLHALARAGVSEVIINVCYFAREIMQKLGTGAAYGVSITYSYEDQKPLGTGAGIYQALPLLGEAPFILVSADIWTTFDYAKLKLIHQDAHLILVSNPDYHPAGDFAIDQRGCLQLQGQKYTYANIAVLHPRLFKQPSKGDPASLASYFRRAIENQAATGDVYMGKWYNVGTPEQLSRVKLDVGVAVK